MARFHPGCDGWMIYCPRLDAYWQWKTVWRIPSAYGGFREQPEVLPSREAIVAAFIESHWWGKDDPRVPQFEWRAVPASNAQANRIAQLRRLIEETPSEIEELDALGAEDDAEFLRQRLKWYQNELRGFGSTA